MNGGDVIGPREGEQVVVAAQGPLMASEPLAPEFRFLQLQVLDHGAHAAVQQQDALGERSLQERDPLRVTPRQGGGSGAGRHGGWGVAAGAQPGVASNVMTAKCGARFSTALTRQATGSSPASRQCFSRLPTVNPRFTWL